MLKKSNLYSIHANRGSNVCVIQHKIVLYGSFCCYAVFLYFVFEPYALGAFGQESNSSITPKDNASSTIMAEFSSVVSRHLSNSSGDVAIVIGAISPNSIDISGYGNLSKENTTKVNGDTRSLA